MIIHNKEVSFDEGLYAMSRAYEQLGYAVIVDTVFISIGTYLPPENCFLAQKSINQGVKIISTATFKDWQEWQELCGFPVDQWNDIIYYYYKVITE